MSRSPRYLLAPICVLLAIRCANSATQHDPATAPIPHFTPSVLPVCKTPNSIETADFNRDGFPDLAIADGEDSSVTILLNNGKGEFSPAPGSPFFTNQHPNDLAIADFNKDGNPDLAIANTETAELTLLLGNGKGQFTEATLSPYKVRSRPHTHGIAVADFNNDGLLDLATDPTSD
jgi:hypothetical protein